MDAVPSAAPTRASAGAVPAAAAGVESRRTRVPHSADQVETDRNADRRPGARGSQPGV